MFFGTNDSGHEYPNTFAIKEENSMPLTVEDRLHEAFEGMKGQYMTVADEVDKLKKAHEKSQHDMDQFAADMREQVGAMGGSFRASKGGPPLADLLVKSLEDRPKVGINMHFRAGFQAKDILNVSTQVPVVDRTIHGGPRLDLRFRDLLPNMSVEGGGSVEYVVETAFTNAANVVAEGALKPKSDKTFEVKNLIFQTIAHYFKVSKQCYTDLPQLASALASNLIYGLGYKLEQQLLLGTGLTGQLQGVYPIATAATALPAPGTGEPANTLIDQLFDAAAQLTAAGFPPSGGVVSATDWSIMQRLKDSTGQYILTAAAPSLPPLVVSPFLTAGQWLVGAFQSQSMLYVREDANVQTATQSEDDFIRNLICMLGELRVGAAWYNAAAFLKNPGV